MPNARKLKPLKTTLSQKQQDRFWRRVVKPEDPNGCWTFLGKDVCQKGYSRIALTPPGVGERYHMQAHRVAYELTHGPIPEGLVLDHLCRNRGCVNPAHLEPVTHRTNVLRGESNAAKRARQQLCSRGHDLSDPAHGLVQANGCRRCLTCKRITDDAYNSRRKANTQANTRRLGVPVDDLT